jgi:hypothetical protein
MKPEKRFRTLKEEIVGLDEFKLKTLNRFPEIADFWEIAENFIEKSECKKIEIIPIPYAIGASLFDRVIINPSAFNQSLIDFLFTLFHEIAHQYQYKKYGYQKMTELYTNRFSIDQAADFMFKTEIVADEFATRKLRELIKLGHLEKSTKLPTGFYKTFPIDNFKRLISTVKSKIQDIDYKTPEQINEVLYNWLKNGFQ